jgi:hypothetical protein
MKFIWLILGIAILAFIALISIRLTAVWQNGNIWTQIGGWCFNVTLLFPMPNPRFFIAKQSSETRPF